MSLAVTYFCNEGYADTQRHGLVLVKRTATLYPEKQVLARIAAQLSGFLKADEVLPSSGISVLESLGPHHSCDASVLPPVSG